MPGIIAAWRGTEADGKWEFEKITVAGMVQGPFADYPSKTQKEENEEIVRQSLEGHTGCTLIIRENKNPDSGSDVRVMK